MKIRSAVTTTQETFSEAGAELSSATVIVVAAAVVENPLAGKGHVVDLEELEVLGNEAAGFLVRQALRALEALGVSTLRFPEAAHGFVHDSTRDSYRAADAAIAWETAQAWVHTP